PNVRKVALCDAVAIALETIGRRPAITNTIMLGAFVKATGVLSIDSVNKAMGEMAFRDAALEKNILAVKRGYDETVVYDV
ncbi:MAG: 2-oxoacid:acceptor oxidoreductase family protein, partial [Deltaproteobacteria bacterium]|nr:2-oxoacid:acceptor oxidoreductase family protein [Deltaproteobacteria bacterium]